MGALWIQLSPLPRTESVLNHGHNNHMVWGEKGDVDLLCCSSVVGTWLAMATVKNDKKSLKITSCSRDVGQFFSSDCTVTQSYAKGTNSRRTPALREKGIFPWGGHSVPARGHPPEGQQSRQTASPEALCGLCVFQLWLRCCFHWGVWREHPLHHHFFFQTVKRQILSSSPVVLIYTHEL